MTKMYFKTIYRFKLCALALAFSPTAFAQLSKTEMLYGTRLSFNQCMDKSQGVTSAMLDCLSAEFSFQDKRLNTAFKKLKPLLTKNKAQELILAQRSWLEFKKHNCQMLYLDGGTASSVSGLSCDVKMTTQRAHELEDFLETAQLLQGEK